MHRLTGLLAVVMALGLAVAPAASAHPRDKLAGGLAELARGGHPWAKPTGPAVQPLPGIVRDGQVLVDVYVSDAVSERAARLREYGMRVEAVSRHEPQRMVEGWLAVSALEDVAALESTRAVVPVYEPVLNTGSVTSEGDAAHRGPQARALGPTGAGIPIGIMSDSINRRGTGVAGSQATGDLPPDVQVLNDPASGTDEGRAMAEVLYDTAPGIPKILFSTGMGGAATRAAHIDALVAAGAKVIADDVVILSEPFFQDGVVAQAVDRAKANGTAYLVSAGNRARQSWEGVFTPGAVVTAENDFDPSAAEDRRQTIATVPNGQQLSIFVQWEDPVGAVTNDFALDFYNANTSAFIGTINSGVATGVPSEGATLNGGPGGTTFAMAIRRVSGTGTPHLKWIANGSFTGSLPAEYPGTSGAIDPDASSARGAITVAAVRHSDVGLNTPESYSSRGPTITRYFDKDGNRLATPDVRLKPDLAGADGVATSSGFDVGSPDLNPFYGTSAAAPSAAGVAALVWSAKPLMSVDMLYAILKDPRGMIDCTSAAGQPDADCGWGFLRADAKVNMALDASPPAVAAVTAPAAPDGANGWFHSAVGLSWNVTDGDSPAMTTNCGPRTVAADAVVAFTCTAQSAGGTTNQPATIMRDTEPPSPPAFTGIRPGAKLKKLPGSVACSSTDATSGIASCVTGKLSSKPGRHRLGATATDVSGLTSQSTLTYTFKPPAARKLRIPRKQGLGSVLRSGLKCTLITAVKRTRLGATLKLGNSVVGQTKAKKRKRGKTTLTIPLTAAGKALLGRASNASLKLTVTAKSRNTSRAKLRAKGTLSP
ncbi:MAG: S8 family serine peptidase [Thermoleophilaceae bacterium]